jgi:hypothetical protein
MGDDLRFLAEIPTDGDPPNADGISVDDGDAISLASPSRALWGTTWMDWGW